MKDRGYKVKNILAEFSVLKCYSMISIEADMFNLIGIGRRFPLNLIVLTVLMAVLGVSVAITTAYYQQESILIAAGQYRTVQEYIVIVYTTSRSLY